MTQKSKRRKAYLFASLLLAAAAGLFVVARLHHLPALEAFAEAALVGGIADWFAVTALFRRPLGLPIPHTALVPANQQRLAHSLGTFVADHFLDPQVLAERLRQDRPALRLAQALSRPALSRAVARQVLALVQAPDGRDALTDLLRTGPVLSRMVGVAMDHHLHHRAFDTLIDAVQGGLSTDPGWVLDRVAGASGRWVPGWVDRRLAQTLLDALIAGLDDLRRDDHPWRHGAEAWLTRLAQRLEEDDGLSRRLGNAAQQGLRDALGQGRAEDILAAALCRRAQSLIDDPIALGRLDRRLIRLSVRVLGPVRPHVGAFIAQVVERWDGPTLVARLEAQIGHDLQFIRINGTLVGGLVGLALYGLSRLMG